MGTFIFKWEHPAQEVYVTGTFDNWSKSEKLEKVGDIFVKDVKLSSVAEKIYYKFVVDGYWVTDHTAPQEKDASGNLNNVLTTDRIKRNTPEIAGIISTVTSSATSADVAKDISLEKVPLGSSGSSDLPGSFPETPAATEREDFSVNPLPAFNGAVNPIKLEPGEQVPEPITLTNNTVTSKVKDDPDLVAANKAKVEPEPTFGVAPLPAFAGAVNPIQVAPGEKIPEPSSMTGNTINSGVTIDKESYEKSGGLGNAPTLPPVITPQEERDQKGTGVLDLPPISKHMIPESSLPMGAAGFGAHDVSALIQSSGPDSTTAHLAGAVPLEATKVPDVVRESQVEAGVDPEASALPEELKEKSAVENELLSEVKEAPSTSEGTGGKRTADKSEKSVAAGDAAAGFGGVAAAFVSGAASNTGNAVPTSITSKLPEPVQNPIDSISATSTNQTTTTAKDIPEVVKDSITKSGESPEAAGSEQAVLDKKAAEKELLSEIKPESSTGESAPDTGGLTAPRSSEPIDSRDVSPGTIPGSHKQNHTEPAVASGVASGFTGPAIAKDAPSTPVKSTPGSSKVDSPAASATADEKKNKRTSFFGKLKHKFSKDK